MTLEKGFRCQDSASQEAESLIIAPRLASSRRAQELESRSPLSASQFSLSVQKTLKNEAYSPGYTSQEESKSSSEDFSADVFFPYLIHSRSLLYEFSSVNPELQEEKIPVVIQNFQDWLDRKDYLVFRDRKNRKFELHLAAKRGNSVYAYRVKKFIEEKSAQFESLEKARLLVRQEGRKFLTNTIYVTLTYDTKIQNGSRFRAWNKTSVFHNRFVSNVRKQFGKVWIFRSQESTLAGYPHEHLILVLSKPLECFKDKNGVWRIEAKNKLSKYWHSFTDIQAVSSTEVLKGYILKDIVKQFSHKYKTDNDNISLALNWLFRKKAFTISGNKVLKGISADLITVLEQLKLLDVRFVEDLEKRDLEFMGMTTFIKDLKGKPPPNTMILDFEPNYLEVRKPFDEGLRDSAYL